MLKEDKNIKTAFNIKIRTVNGLTQKGRRFRARVTEIGRKLVKNPHRADFIPTVEAMEAIIEERDFLVAERERFPHNLTHDFQWDMYEVRGLIKDLYTVACAHRDLHDKF